MEIDLNRLSAPEKLLWSCGIREPEHIDLEAIANYRGAHVVYRHLDGCAARLVKCGTQAVISVATGGYEGRQRFSLAHELAHWICDRNEGSFHCGKEDIGPQNTEAKDIEAHANAYASQLILPNFLVEPWMDGKRANLDTAKALGTAFNASLTASAIKVVKRAGTAACVVCHSKLKLLWFQKNLAFPHDFYVKKELHHDTAAFSMAFCQGTQMSRAIKEAANRWLSGPDDYRLMVESQSVKLPDESVLSVISLLK